MSYRPPVWIISAVIMDEAKCAEPASCSEAVADERAVAESTVDVPEVQAGSNWATCTSVHTTTTAVALFLDTQKLNQSQFFLL